MTTPNARSPTPGHHKRQEIAHSEGWELEVIKVSFINLPAACPAVRATGQVRRLRAIDPRPGKVPPQRTVSRILFPPSRRPSAALRRTTTIPLALSLLTGSSGLPGSLGRAVRQAPRCQDAGAPLFGLAPCGVLPATRVATGAVRSYRTFSPLLARGGPEAARTSAVCFLCHFPSGCPDRALPGALPCGVRTFLSPAHRGCDGERLSGLLRRLEPIQPSVSCVIPYCSSFL